MTLAQLAPAAEPAGWLWQALTSPLSLFCAALLVLGVVGLLLSGRVLYRIGRQQRRAAATDESGMATLEFALVLPVLLFFVLMLMQTTLVMGGNIFVHYAAYAATREAIVQIPTGEGDLFNRYDEGGEKHEAIRQDAYLALIPVAGRESSGDSRGENYAEAFRAFYAGYGVEAPRWVDTMLADRYRYAADHTEVTVHKTIVHSETEVEFQPITGSYTFGYRDPVTVSVTHEFNLSIPLARAIFQDGRDGRFAYTQVTAHYTLTNEGINPQMPPLPEIDRRP